MSEFDSITMHAFANRSAITGSLLLDSINYAKLEADHAPQMLRWHHCATLRELTGKHDTVQMFLRMPDGAFVQISDHIESCIRVTADTSEQVKHWLAYFATRYAKRAAPKRPTFSIIHLAENGPGTTQVDITRSFALSDDNIRLLYGDGFLAWERTLISTMKTKETGVFLFQGQPGTGKTSFIRHLMDKLKKTHRFYYLPVTNEELLTSPRMVEFWARECRLNEKQKKVIILEDAEQLLERCPHGRSGAVANLLNIADGILGELLKVQILCTVNCPIVNLDEAITRPGRLLDYHEFSRLPREQAQRIAEKYNKQLPDLPDYALSDIFGAQPTTAPKSTQPKRIMGFASGLANKRAF